MSLSPLSPIATSRPYDPPITIAWVLAGRTGLELDRDTPAGEVYAAVVEAQRFLSQGGFLSGNEDDVADGKWGKRTRTAMQTFLARYPRPEGAELLAHLRETVSRFRDAFAIVRRPDLSDADLTVAHGVRPPLPRAPSVDRFVFHERAMIANLHAIDLPEPHSVAEIRRDQPLPSWVPAEARARIERYFRGLDAPFGRTLKESTPADLLIEASHHQRQLSLKAKNIPEPSAYGAEIRAARLREVAQELTRRLQDRMLVPAVRYRLAGEAGLSWIALAFEAERRGSPDRASELRARARAAWDVATNLVTSGAFRGARHLPQGTFWLSTPPSTAAYDFVLNRAIAAYDEKKGH